MKRCFESKARFSTAIAGMRQEIWIVALNGVKPVR